ncbi:hypothetical protein ACI2JA_03175 [Alkalihalobacillus sp. NPDC078783]
MSKTMSYREYKYKEGTFWEVLQKSEEGEMMEMVEWPHSQKIVNNGDYHFYWNESMKPVVLSGEFVGSVWKISKERAF